MSHLNALPVDAAGSAPPLRKPVSAARRAAQALLGVALAHALLAATHKGEFWPFSIYPMFAQAGRSWARALVVEIPLGAPSALREQYGLDDLPGAPLGLEQYGIPQNDLSSLVQRADRWGAPERAALERLFATLPGRRNLVVLIVRGTLADGALHYVAHPMATLECDQGRVNALLRGSTAALQEPPR